MSLTYNPLLKLPGRRMQLYTVLALLCLTAVAVYAEIVRYDGHKVIRVKAADLAQLKWLAKLHDESTLDFWTYPSRVRPTDIRLSPEDYKNITDQLSANGLNYTIAHHDVQKLIEGAGQHPQSPDKRQLKFSTETVIGGFPTLDKIYKWLKEQEAVYSSIMSVDSIGQTHEGREQYITKIGIPGSDKPIIWLDSGSHGREWISVSTGLNIINKLLNGYNDRDQQIVALLQAYDWYILPVANPDGYEYTHTAGGRLWRATRTNYGNGAIGADPNRNWDYYWCITGASHISTSPVYCGPNPWSERCVYNMKNALASIKSRLRVYVTLHSYGQLVLVPYAWSRVSYPSDYYELARVGQQAAAAIKQSGGATYRVGRVPNFYNVASGSSMDWVKGTLGTKYVFGLELRPQGQLGTDGFIISPSYIKPVAQEAWEGIQVMANEARKRRVIFG